jgi:hypothetical protein
MFNRIELVIFFRKELLLSVLQKSEGDFSAHREVSNYFTNYDKVRDWHLVPRWLDGRDVLAVFHDPRDAPPGYFMELALVDGRVASIRDFRYVPYIARDATMDFLADR